MGLLAVEGIYKDGRVELSEPAAGAPAEARVIVTFLPSPATGASEASATPSPEEKQAAFERLMARFDKGIDFGGDIPFRREDIYNERMDELDRRRSGQGDR